MAAFKTLKEIKSEPPVLSLPNINDQLHVFTESFKEAVGTAWMQRNDVRKLKAIQFASRSPTNVEKRYRTNDKEAVATTISLKKFSHYLLSAPFKVYSDHKAL